MRVGDHGGHALTSIRRRRGVREKWSRCLTAVAELHFHLVDHGKAVAVPLDGTGPSYAAHFFDFDLENIRAVRQGDVLAEEDTDLFRTVAHGSDGSRSFFYFQAHFTMDANGQTTVQLEMDRLVCA